MQAHTRLYLGIPLMLLAGSLCLLRQGIAQDALHGWKTEARTTAIELAAVEQPGRTTASTTFVLKNVSPNPIMTIAVSLDGGETFELADYFHTPTTLQPGATYSLYVPKRAWRDKALVLLAVVFASGAAEGREDAIGYIRANHLGQALEVERIKDVLYRQAVQDGQDPDDLVLDTIDGKVGTRPNSPAEAFAAVQGVRMPGADTNAVKSAGDLAINGFYSGVSAARMLARGTLEQLRRVPVGRLDPPTRADLFSEWKKSCATASARNHALLEAAGGVR
jgi:hypothetical protein